MIINEKSETFEHEGRIWLIGQRVKANAESIFEGLYGTIEEIRTGDDKDTENEGPDFYICFEEPVVEKERKEIEDRISEAYKCDKKIEDAGIEEVIMAPEMLEPVMLLSSQNVMDIVKEVMADKESDENVTVEGPVTTMFISKERLKEHEKDILEMLRQLPDEFFIEAGGGMSFLQACVNRDGYQWGEHRDIEFLFLLGIATGYGVWTFPKELWPSLPGGMPYFMYDVEKDKLAQMKEDRLG